MTYLRFGARTKTDPKTNFLNLENERFEIISSLINLFISKIFIL